MPTDIELTWDTELQGCKMSFAANDVVTSSSLLTAVLVSLFTDARAADDDPLPDPRNDDRRGWWGDATNTALPTDSVGSKLWLLEREKNTVDAVKRGKTYVQEALAWLVSEGVAKSVDVIVEAQPLGNSGTIMLAFKAEITKPDGVNETFKFEQEWRATADGLR